MPRANRYHIPGYIWHLTHRCHKKEFLLKFSKDRRRWIEWLFQAKHRYGLRILNYIVTCNHIHLLVLDNEKPQVMSRSLQLIAGRTAQEFNLRKSRKGAFWEDRYHATAIEKGAHLIRCLTYIDMNMVRAGRVNHPIQWPHSGYYEMERAPHRKGLLDYEYLLETFEISTLDKLKALRKNWIEEKMANKQASRESEWTESVAVGSREFICEMKKRQGIRAWTRAIKPISGSDSYQLKDKPIRYDVIRAKRPH